MKKCIILFLVSLLILNIFVISLIKAQDSDALPPEINKVKGIGENLTNPEIRSQYLKQEWGKILANNTFFGPIIAGYEKISPYTDPVLKYTLGLEPSLTWLFVLTLVLWIAFVVYAFRILDLASIFSKWVQYIISFGVVIIISITGITRKLAEYIINALSKFTIWWMQLIGIGIVILALVVASILSKNVKEVGKAMKERKAKTKEEINRQKLKTGAEVAETFTKGMTKK